MFWPVAVLAVLSVIGGWIQFATVWTPISDFLAPAAEPLVEATGTQELVSSVFGVLFGLGGMAAAWAWYGARRAPAPRVPQAQRALERKLWWDDLYDALFYRPAVWLAKALLRWVERLLIAGSIAEVALGHAPVRPPRRTHPDRPRPRVRARARGRPRSPRRRLHLGALTWIRWLATILIFLPVAGALACFVLPLGRRDRLRSRCWSRSWRSASGSSRSRASTSRRASSSSSAPRGSAT